VRHTTWEEFLSATLKVAASKHPFLRSNLPLSVESGRIQLLCPSQTDILRVLQLLAPPGTEKVAFLHTEVAANAGRKAVCLRVEAPDESP
jgi:hypothetical protein